MHVKRLKKSVRRFDEKLTKSIVRLPKFYRPLMVALSWLAGPSVVTIVAGILVTSGLIGDRLLAMVGALIVLVSVAGGIAKIIVKRKRPLTHITKGWLKTYSFPSGHTVGGTVTYVGLGFLLATYSSALSIASAIVAFIFVLLSLIIVGVGISRVYLGAHYPSDVVVGWIFGGILSYLGIWIFLCV